LSASAQIVASGVFGTLPALKVLPSAAPDWPPLLANRHDGSPPNAQLRSIYTPPRINRHGTNAGSPQPRRLPASGLPG
jgi:hypothetical protein